MHLDELVLTVSILTVIVAILAFKILTQPPYPMDETLSAGSDVEAIVTRYKNGQLSELDDVALVKAADKLDYAHKHYFDGKVLSEMPLMLFHQAQNQQRELRHIADSIWRLLSTRYGCND